MEAAHIEVVAQALCDDHCACTDGCDGTKRISGKIIGPPWFVAHNLLVTLEQQGYSLVKKENG